MNSRITWTGGAQTSFVVFVTYFLLLLQNFVTYITKYELIK